jgi:PTS system nitrogen regulatory IIA component
MHFGTVLRLLRVDAGLTLHELARRVGVSTAYLSRVECGHDAAPTYERLATIAGTLHLPPDVLSELAQRLDPAVSEYLDGTPAAHAVLRELAERKLTAMDLGRVRAFVQSEFPRKRAADGVRPARIAPLVTPERVIAGLVCADLDDAIDLAALRLAAAPEAEGASAPVLADHILRREQEAPTTLGAGVVVPHARARTARPIAAIATLARPLALATPDGVPVRIAVVLLTPLKGREHLALLAHVARLARDGLARRLAEIRDPRRVLAEFASFEAGYD